MGFENNAIKAGSLDVEKSKGGKKKKKKNRDGDESGCCLRLSFIGSCIPSRSKVDNSISGTTTSAHSCKFFHFVSIFFMYVSLLWLHDIFLFGIKI